MSKAEEDFEMMKKARRYLPDNGYSKRELNLAFYMFDKGYHQAENDLELTWEDIKKIYHLVNEVSDDLGIKAMYVNIYQEVLKRFKKSKK